jgi:feruloyl-CoA synthase
LKPEEIKKRISAVLRELAKEGGSSTHPVRAIIMTEPPSIDANEITDKGYMNQRAVLERRTAVVEQLYSGAAEVISA